MEALAAVGLAGNIVQFVDFTTKLFNYTASAYKSQAGSSNSICDFVANTLQDLSKSLSLDEHIQIQSPAPKQKVEALQKLAQDCQKTAHELLSALQQLKTKNPKSLRSNIRAALATIRKKSEMDELYARLDRYRALLMVQLQVIQNDNLHAIFSALVNEFDDKNHKLGTRLGENLFNLKMEITKAIESLRLELTNASNQNPRADQDTSQSNVHALAASLVQSETSGANMIASINLLQTLVFEEMDHRYSTIRDPHPKSFEPVLDSRIIPWLQSNELLFWISGKPGSGKSTLMKCLVDDPRIRVQMQQRSGLREASIASYYFWVNGSQLQRSQEGLLRRLLYEVLSQNMHLMEQAIPQSWGLARTMVFRGKALQAHTWKRDELLSAFQKLAAIGMDLDQLCIFIDGLDEYAGDYDEIVAIIENLKAMKIKICISSRPLNVFKAAFGRNQEFKLCLEDLNKPAIQLYVRENLQNRQDFRTLCTGFSKAQEIAQEVVERSLGVFLWVVLVVRSLIQGLRNCDGIALLERRLKGFPSDLYEFFRYIFESIDPFYRKSVAHMFEMALYGPYPLPDITYWYMDELEDPNITWKNLVQDLGNDSVKERNLSLQARINGRCMGLLEMRNGRQETMTWDANIDFLHRTAKDYVQLPEVQEKLLSWRDENFAPQCFIFNSLIAAANLLFKRPSTDHEDQGMSLLNVFFELVYSLEKRNDIIKVEYADAMEQLVTENTNIDMMKSYLQFRVPSFFAAKLTMIYRCQPSPSQSKLALLERYLGEHFYLSQSEVLLSTGPIVEVDKGIQDVIAMIVSLTASGATCDLPREIMPAMRAVFKGVVFKDDIFTKKLNRVLRKILQPDEMEELLETMVQTRRRMEEQNKKKPENTQ